MVDRTESLKKIGDVKYYGYGLYEVEVSLSDTVTLADFASTVNLGKAVLMKESDGLEVTCTVANNVVTVTGSGTNMKCILFAYGVRA
jgi:hypothetical protein